MKECSTERPAEIRKGKEMKGKVPEMDKFVQFWAGIWEDETSTPHRIWIRTVAEKIRAKVTDVEELTANEKKLYETVKRRKIGQPLE